MENETININGRKKDVPHGSLLSECLQEYSEVRMPCAGNGRCGKCKVKVKGMVSMPDSREKKFLTQEELEAGIRLACRTKLLGACSVFLEGMGTEEVVLSQDEKVSLDCENFLFQTMGAAIDIGTTTLAVSLYDKTGVLAKEGAVNPQISFGADVISRIQRSMNGEGMALARAVQTGISQLLHTVCQKSGYSIEQIDTLIVTGNTAMLYLYTQRCPTSLSCTPFVADWLAGEWRSGEQLGCPNAKVYMPHCISAFVGADITMALLATQMSRDTKKRLLVDIGTNGEIVLWTGNDFCSCSTAAGPAFEGAGLSMGMDAAEGAISAVSLQEGKMDVQVIGNQEPIGICGSGVIDAVYCLLQAGRIDETGYLEEKEAQIAGVVKITQEDIRKVQLAKSAICAGIETILYREQIKLEELEEVLIAGGFGSRLHLKNAVGIGLLPQIEQEKIVVCGNAALTGAELLLCQKELLEEEQRLAGKSRNCNLAEDPFFQERYIEGMLFSEQK